MAKSTNTTLIDQIKELSDQEIDQVLAANLGPQKVNQSDFDPYEWENQREYMCSALVAFRVSRKVR